MNHFKKFPRSSVLVLLLFLFLLHAAPLSYASRRQPFNRQLKALIEKKFYKEGVPSLEKIDRYRRAISKRRREVEQNLKNLYRLEEDLPKKEAAKKAGKKDEIRTYKILLGYIKRLKKRTAPAKEAAFQRLAAKVLALDYALKMEGKKLASVMLVEKVPASFKKRMISIRGAPQGEASNLVNPGTGLFYSQEELSRFKQQGGDVSKLNPPEDSTFWTRHPISRIDVRKHYCEGRDALHEGLAIIFPRKKAVFKKIRKTQTKPKIDVCFRHNGKMLSFKLKIGAEVHSEVTCSALYSLLGFSVDISKYVRDFKIVLGKVSHHQFRKEWESYYSRYPLEKFIKKQGSDEEGNYIIFHEGVLEAKPKELLRVGPWAYGQNGNAGFREVRGSLIFNMWVSNLDLKEAENNKLILRKSMKSGDRYRFYHIQHDMGFAFGSTYIERPGSFSWKLVKKKTQHHILMNYRCFQENSLFKYVTYADARWMARLIARLTRKQINDTLTIGGWPDSLRKLLLEKLIARRNQLVEAFDLVGEKTPEGDTIALMAFDRYLTTADGVVKKGKLKVYNFDGYPQYFGPRINEVAALVLKGLRNTAVDGLVRLTGSLRYIKIDPETFGLDERIVSKIILRMEREIEANPNPLNEGESFLVKDSLEIGFRLGYGYVVSGDVAYSRKYTLVYPVGNRDAGRFHDKFILNLFLPFERRGRYLPPNHVMMFEDYLEGRGRLKLNPDDTPVVLTLTASKIYLHRHFLSFKDPRRAIFFQDKSLYNELKLRFYLEFAHTFRFPLFKTYIQNGTLNRNYIEIDTTDLESNEIKQKALEELIRDGNPASARKVGKQKFIKGHFLEKKRYLSLFGFLRNRSVYRVDRLTETQFPGEGTGDTSGAGNPPIVNHHLQVESRKLKEWRFLDNGERHFSTIRFTGKGGGKNGGKTVTEPLLSLSLRVNDNSTHNTELKEGYLDFINRVALRKKFIRFNPGSHTVNRLWGSTQVFVNFLFYPEAFGNLINAGEETIWRSLAEVSGKPVEYWRRKSRPEYRRGRPVQRCCTGDRYLAVKTKYLVRELRKARKAGDSFKRMRHVVKAVRKTVYTSGQTFSPFLLAVIHKLAGKGNVYMDALVTFPGNKENVFPARVPLYNETGKDRGLSPRFFQFIFDDPSEIYHLF